MRCRFVCYCIWLYSARGTSILLRIEKSTVVINFTSGKGNEVLSCQRYKLAMKEFDQEFEHLFAS